MFCNAVFLLDMVYIAVYLLTTVTNASFFRDQDANGHRHGKHHKGLGRRGAPTAELRACFGTHMQNTQDENAPPSFDEDVQRTHASAVHICDAQRSI